MKFFTLLVLLSGFVLTLPAQVATGPGVGAREATDLLENGTLLVRLPSERNKIAALQRLATEQPERATELQERIDRIEADRDRRNRIVMAAMNESFPFRSVRYFYDYHSKALAASDGNDFFLDEQLQPGTDQQIPDAYLVLHLGNKIGRGQSVDGAQLLDRDYRPLGFGFPDFSKEQTFASLFRSLGGREQAEQKNLERMILRLNRRWEKYVQTSKN